MRVGAGDVEAFHRVRAALPLGRRGHIVRTVHGGQIAAGIGGTEEFRVFETKPHKRKHDLVGKGLAHPLDGVVVDPEFFTLVPIAEQKPGDRRTTRKGADDRLEKGVRARIELVFGRPGMEGPLGLQVVGRKQGVQLPEPVTAFRHVHGGKNVDRYSLRVAEGAAGIVHETEPVPELGPRCGVGRIGFLRLQEDIVGKEVWREGEESPVVVDRHLDVDVVVPRYESAVADRTEQGASVQPVFQVRFGTDRVEYFQKPQHDELAAPQGRVALRSQIGNNFVEILHRKPSGQSMGTLAQFSFTGPHFFIVIVICEMNFSFVLILHLLMCIVILHI